MIQPTEEIPGQYGHPAWKRNVFAALMFCAIGVALMVSVVFIVYGAVLFAAGLAWAVIAWMVGMMQERSSPEREHLPHT